MTTLFVFLNIPTSNILLFLRLFIIIIIGLHILNFDPSGYTLMSDGTGGDPNIDTGGGIGGDPNTGGENSGNAGQSPAGPEQGPWGWVSFGSEDDGDKAIRNLMHDKIINHRISCANTNPYDSRLGNKFTPQEHEYICDQVMKYVKANPKSKLRNFVKGKMPERRYEGRISAFFVRDVFPKS